MSIAGVDFSSRAVHICLLDDDTDGADVAIITLHGATPFERARSMRSDFPSRSWWEREGVWLVGVEDPHSRANHTAKALGLAAGAIAALLPSGLTVIQTPPVEWKRVFVGDAMASKAVVEMHARSVWPDPPDGADDNTWDAYGIAYAVRTLNQQAIQKASFA